MISISTVIPSSNTPLIIDEEKTSLIMQGVARINRIKTLDGSSYVSHRGYTDSDRTFDIKAFLSDSDSAVLWDLFSQEMLLTISADNGCFSGVISTLNINNGNAKIKILIAERLN